MAKKIDDILNPPPPPPDRDEEKIIKFLKESPDTGFTFNEIVTGTALGRDVQGIGASLLIGVLGELTDPDNRRRARLRVKVDKLVQEEKVQQGEADGATFYWLAARPPTQVAAIQ